MFSKTCLSGLVYVLFAAETAQGDSGQTLVKSHFAHQFIAAAIGQSNVADEQVEFLCANFLYGLLSGMGDADLVAAAFQHSFHAETGILMIVHQQDTPVGNNRFRFPIHWAILSVPVAFDRSVNGV